MAFRNPRLKFFLKYDKNGNVIPSSGILRKRMPTDTQGTWVDASNLAFLCCFTTTTTTSTSTTTTTTTAAPTTTTTTTAAPTTTTTTTGA